MKTKINILDYQGLIISIARKFKRYAHMYGVPFEDLISEGNLRFLKEVGNYDSERGEITTYMTPRIRGAVLDYIENQKRKKLVLSSTISSNETYSFDENIEDKNANNQLDIADKNELTDIIKRCIKQLTPRERKVIDYVHGIGGNREYAEVEIAKILGVSKNKINLIKKTAYKKLKIIILQEIPSIQPSLEEIIAMLRNENPL